VSSNSRSAGSMKTLRSGLLEKGGRVLLWAEKGEGVDLVAPSIGEKKAGLSLSKNKKGRRERKITCLRKGNDFTP